MENENSNNKFDQLKGLIAPDVESRKATRKVINDYAYYVMIALVSLLVVFIPPLVYGSVTGDLQTAFPQTPLAWVLWGILNASTGIGNVSILVFFKLQAKKNSANHPNYIKANEILSRISGNKETFIPRSPEQMNTKEYTTKVACILLSTVCSFVAIASLVINFSLMNLLSTLVSVIIAVIMSWTTMLKNEEYWTEEYLLYAQMKEKEFMARESAEMSLKAEESTTQEEVTNA